MWRFEPASVWYIGEFMVSSININNGIKEPTRGYQNCNISLIDGYVKVRESLYTRVINWVITILNHIDTRKIVPTYEGSCMVYRPKWHRKFFTIKYSYPTGIKKCEILIIDTPMVSKEDNISPTLVRMKNILFQIIEGQTHFGMPCGAKIRLTL